MTLQRATQDGIVGSVVTGLDINGASGPVLLPAVQLVGSDGAAQLPDLPTGATQLGASSGNVANASAVATLAGAASKTTYITSLQVTASGATTGKPVVVTVAGLLGGTQSFIFTFPAGVLVAAQPLAVPFWPPMPASAVNTDIVATLPAGGAGNTNAAVSASGFRL